MHCATLVYPCDNKRLLGGLESILGLFIVDSDSASRSGLITAASTVPPAQQSATAPPQTTSTAPQATAGHWAHTRAALGTAGQLPLGERVYIYSTGLSFEKSITVQTTSTVYNTKSDLYLYLII